MEAKAYELEQSTALAAEAKTVLDSWVRYEGQVKQRQQTELAETIISKIQKELENPKVLQQILQQSIADIESMCHPCIWLFEQAANTFYRDRPDQGINTLPPQIWPLRPRFPRQYCYNKTPCAIVNKFQFLSILYSVCDFRDVVDGSLSYSV